jgi:hypothetical protein
VGPWRVGAVARRRGAGRPAAARKTIRVAEVLRLGSDGLFSEKKEHTGLIENFGRTSPARRSFQNLQENNGTMARNHIYIKGSHVV